MREFLRTVVATTVLLIGLAGNALAQEPIRFGVSTAVSGDAAAYGKPFLDAIQFTAEEFNKSGGIMGRPVQVIYYDDRGVPDQGLQVAKKFKAVEVRKAHVQHGQRGRFGGEQANGFLGRTGPHGGKTVGGQHILQGVGNAGFVFNDEDAGFT